MSEQQSRDLLPAYVLDALDADEATAVEAQLSHSERLRREARGLRQVAAHLPYAAPQYTPPDRVRQQLFARVEASKERTSPAAVAQRALPVPARRGALLTRSFMVLSALLLAVTIGLGAVTLRLSQQTAAALEANRALATQLGQAQQMLDDTRAAQEQLAASIAENQRQLGASQSQLSESRRQLDETNAQLAASRQEIAALANQLDQQRRDFVFVSAPGVATRDLQPTAATSQATGRMYMRPGDTEAVIVFRGLGSLEPGKVYEFWLAQGSRQVAVGTVVADAEGNARLTIHAPEEVNAFDQVMLTVETQPGGQTPSGPTVLEGRLSS